MKINNFLDRKKILFLFLIIFLCLFLEIFQNNLPRIHFGEVPGATRTIDILKGKHCSFFISGYLFGRDFLLMSLPYHGSLSSYILIPFFPAFGINVFSLRLAPIFFWSIGITIYLFFVKEFLNRKVAFITIFLLIVSPVFILKTKLDNIASYSALFSVVALFFLLRWYRNKGVFGNILIRSRDIYRRVVSVVVIAF